MLEPAEFVAFAELRIAGQDIRPAMVEIERSIETVETDAGNEDRRHRDQSHGLTAGR